MCKRPNSALIGSENLMSNQKSPCQLSFSNKTECGNKCLPPRKTLERTFLMISLELQHLRRYFFLQIESESRFRSNGVRNSLRMTVVLVIAVSLHESYYFSLRLPTSCRIGGCRTGPTWRMSAFAPSPPWKTLSSPPLEKPTRRLPPVFFRRPPPSSTRRPPASIQRRLRTLI